MGLSIDREKVIKGLQQHCEGSMFDRCGECPYYEVADEPFQCRDELLMDVLTLLKEQEAVEPVVDIDTWKCGNCGYTLEHQKLFGDNVLFHEQYDYCPGCGKKVKWND